MLDLSFIPNIITFRRMTKFLNLQKIHKNVLRPSNNNFIFPCCKNSSFDNIFFFGRPNSYFPVHQSIDSVTNILFSSGTTGKISLLRLCSLFLAVAFVQLVHSVIPFASVRRSKSNTLDSPVSHSMCC